MMRVPVRPLLVSSDATVASEVIDPVESTLDAVAENSVWCISELTRDRRYATSLYNLACDRPLRR